MPTRLRRPSSTSSVVLAGDIGGTKALLELARRGPDGGMETIRRAELPSAGHAGLEDLVREFLAGRADMEKPAAAAFSVAAPIVAGRGHFTNLPWILDEQHLSRALGIRRLTLLNDFVAACHGLDELTSGDLLTLAPAEPDPAAPRVVVGAGTGLGQGYVVPTPRGPLAFPSEGGHASFAPRDASDHPLHTYLLGRYRDRVSAERVLSGEGLALIESFLRGGPPLEPAEVTARAQRGENTALAAVRLFLELYGSYVGDIALHFLARGGVYVAGGLVVHLLPWIQEGGFLESFRAKGRMRPLLESLPLHLVRNPALELLGARRYAASTLR